MGVLNAHDLVATVVNPLEVGWRCEIEGELKPVVGGFKLH
jgi:hypothetical protein